MEQFAREELTDEEYKIFCTMGQYDKIHCVKCAKAVILKSEVLKGRKWVVAALLHDCGKPAGTGFIARTVHALFKNVKSLKNHSETGYEIVKNINPEAAEIIKVHHLKDVTNEIKRFQEIDDSN